MHELTENDSLAIIKQNFPDSISYWEKFSGEINSESSITLQFIPFAVYTIDIINSDDQLKIRQIFELIEYLLTEGVDSVQTAVTTVYLEYLVNSDPDKIQFSKFVKHMGKESIAYCCAWDEFTGVRTKGL